MFICINWPAYDVISEPCLIAVGCMQVLGMYIGVGLKMKRVKQLHLCLQELIDKIPDDDEQTYYLYWNTEQKCRDFSAKFVKFIVVNQLMFVAALFFSIYCMIVGNFDTSTWILPFECWVPFSTETPYGYYLKWFIQFSMGIAYSSSQVTITAYFVCCCHYIVSICDHYKFVMKLIGLETEKNQEEKSPLIHQKRNYEIRRKLAEAINIHMKSYEVFNMVADVNTGVIFALLPANTLLLAFTMFNTEHTTFDLVMFVWHIISIACALIWPALFCYFASHTSENVISMGVPLLKW
ncbi:uncharacterized protein LOC129564952 [Sitodiplosis mosellana]|uniref:uncharacterized protein LOC129564952 n=1 Tax=Sitodiplosis mosellana TaxID=263140 RepID=UPI002443AA42|nr:uncharacterized protein LOC129564952 [Sitodiplosis mosellana]